MEKQTSSNGDAQNVVETGEEEVDANPPDSGARQTNCGQDVEQRVAHEHHLRRRQRDCCAAANRDPNVRLR